MKSKVGSLTKIKETDKPSATLTNKTENTSPKSSNGGGNISTDFTEIKRIIREY